MQHLAVRTGIYSIKDLAYHYKARTNGHWFDDDTLRFFKSRLSESLVYGDAVILFVSSECGPDGARKYSVRQYTPETGNIETIGQGFQGYATLKSAHVDAKRLVK